MSLLYNFLQLQAQEKYLSLLLEAVTGDSEDLRRVSSEIGGLMFLTVVIFSLQLALADIQSNPSIANILPDLAQYLEETVSYVIRGRERERERESGGECRRESMSIYNTPILLHVSSLAGGHNSLLFSFSRSSSCSSHCSGTALSSSSLTVTASTLT